MERIDQSSQIHVHGVIFPFTATDMQAHTYSMAGWYDVKVGVSDDDGDERELVVTIIIT